MIILWSAQYFMYYHYYCNIHENIFSSFGWLRDCILYIRTQTNGMVQKRNRFAYKFFFNIKRKVILLIEIRTSCTQKLSPQSECGWVRPVAALRRTLWSEEEKRIKSTRSTPIHAIPRLTNWTRSLSYQPRTSVCTIYVAVINPILMTCKLQWILYSHNTCWNDFALYREYYYCYVLKRPAVRVNTTAVLWANLVDCFRDVESLINVESQSVI